MRFDDAFLLILLGVVAMLLAPSIAGRLWNRRVHSNVSGESTDRCPTCDYDRRGSGPACPECGDTTPRFVRVGLDPIKLQANWPASEIAPRVAAIDEKRLTLWTGPHAGLAGMLAEQLRSRGIPATRSSIDDRLPRPLDPSAENQLIRVVVPEIDFERALLIADTFARSKRSD